MCQTRSRECQYTFPCQIGQGQDEFTPALLAHTHLAKHDQQTRFTAGTITDNNQLPAEFSHDCFLREAGVCWTQG